MSTLVTAAQVAVGINILLLLGLCWVWGRNYYQLRSKHTLGMLVFAALLLAENGFSLYYYLVDPTLSAWFSTSVPDPAWQAMLLFHVLEMLALAFLSWVTFD